MDKTQKLLSKIPQKDAERIRASIQLLVQHKITGTKLQKSNSFKYRVGNYRILYKEYKKERIITGVRKRNEKTYQDI